MTAKNDPVLPEPYTQAAFSNFLEKMPLYSVKADSLLELSSEECSGRKRIIGKLKGQITLVPGVDITLPTLEEKDFYSVEPVS